MRAWYGALNKPLAEQVSADQPHIIDVTIPLQAMVKDSQLHLHPHSKVCHIRERNGKLFWGEGYAHAI